MNTALPGSCSALWDSPELPAWGTAASAAFVIALEQPGAWGAQALTQSGLDPHLGGALEAACSGTGGRALLIRTPARRHRHADPAGPRRVLLAGGFAADPWLLSTSVSDPGELLNLPFDRLASLAPAEAAAALGWTPAPPVLLVCTNGRRDVCCAITGRGIAEAVAGSHPGQVWEASHLGGHRFAPTAVVLPVGTALGRLTPALAAGALDAAADGLIAASSLDQRHFRGRMCLTPGEQVADAAVRIASGELKPGALTVTVAPGGADVRHTDGRAWHVATAREKLPALPVSCGRPPEPTMVWRATMLLPEGDLGSSSP